VAANYPGGGREARLIALAHSISLLVCTALLCACVRPRTTPAAAGCVDDEPTLGPPSRLTVTAGAKTSDVEGVVILSETGNPLPGARLWIDAAATESVETAADGRFVFRAVSPGRHAIAMRRIGVRGLRDSIDVPLAGQLRVEAEPVANDGGCDSFGEVTVAKP
jgi:hypothetical protein